MSHEMIMLRTFETSDGKRWAAEWQCNNACGLRFVTKSGAGAPQLPSYHICPNSGPEIRDRYPATGWTERLRGGREGRRNVTTLSMIIANGQLAQLAASLQTCLNQGHAVAEQARPNPAFSLIFVEHLARLHRQASRLQTALFSEFPEPEPGPPLSGRSQGAQITGLVTAVAAAVSRAASEWHNYTERMDAGQTEATADRGARNPLNQALADLMDLLNRWVDTIEREITRSRAGAAP